MRWIAQNKTAIGSVLVAISTPLISFGNEYIVLFGQILLPIGTALLGGGVLRSDSYYRPYEGPDRRNNGTGEFIKVTKP